MLQLVYVNPIGKDYTNQYVYEFYFDDELTSFKIFYWLKNIVNVESYNGKKEYR